MFDLKKLQEKKSEISAQLYSLNPSIKKEDDFGVYGCSGCSGTCEGSCNDTCQGQCHGCGKS